MKNYKKIIAKFATKKILVIGDIILDQYITGSVSRISPEAPVPIVLQEKFSDMPGGAANVANNLISLGSKVSIIGIVGKDKDGDRLKTLLKEKNIDVSGLFSDDNTVTAVKTRIIAQHQQVVRVDRERNIEINLKLFAKIKKFLIENLKEFDAVIVSDYGKGVITKDLIHFVCDLAKKQNKIITVDPKVEHFDSYKNVTAITPNKKEAENAIRYIKIKAGEGHKLEINIDNLTSNELVEQAGKALLKFLDLESLLITLGENGMMVFEKNMNKVFHIPTRAQEVFDVSGAGDTVISVFTLALSSAATKLQAAELSNFAAGVVVGKMGAVAITKKDLISAIRDQ